MVKSKNNILSIVKNDLKNDNRVSNQAISLINEGYNVTVLSIQMKTNLPSDEWRSGFRIIRVISTNRIINKIRYVRGIVFKFTILTYALDIIIKKKHDYIHCHDLNTLHIGFLIKLLSTHKVKLLYDAHELETNRNFVFGFKRVLAKIKESFLIKYCDKVITVSDSIADEYVRLYGISKPIVILNCPVIDVNKDPEKHEIFRKKFNISNTNRIILYQGYLYDGRGIDIILKAFKKLDNDNLSLVFMGEGPLSNKIKDDNDFNKSVFIHPFVPSDEILKHTSSADFGISFIEDISLSDRYCLPNKLFEYIAAGLPIITSGLPEMKKFVENNKVGVSAEKNNVNGFILAFNELLKMDSNDLQKNIKETRKLYNWSTQEKILVDLYHNFEL